VTILSGGSVDGLVGAIRHGDLARLTSIPGVGQEDGRTDRCRIERLSCRISRPKRRNPAVETDVLSALENLGYSRPVVEAALRRAVNGDEGAGFEVLFKRALQILTKE
jgi:Holliday junction resolvasome RuvABC DNA-binding subunit